MNQSYHENMNRIKYLLFAALYTFLIMTADGQTQEILTFVDCFEEKDGQTNLSERLSSKETRLSCDAGVIESVFDASVPDSIQFLHILVLRILKTC